MKTLPAILTQLHTDISADLPALIIADGLTALDRYLIGPPRNETENTLSIYIDSNKHDDTNNDLSIMFQMQLNGINYEDAVKYAEVFKDYMSAYDPERLGMIIMQSLSCDIWPLEKGKQIHIYFDMSFTEALDSCD